MIRNIALMILVLFSVISCKNESSDKGTFDENTAVTVNEIDELRLTLPSTYKEINAVQDLRKFLDDNAANIIKTDAGLLASMVRHISMNHHYFFDAESDENINYVLVDRVGPRFPLQDDIIEKFIAMFEKDNKTLYASRDYVFQRLGTERSEVLGNQVLNFKHKHTLDDLVWYTDYYYLQMKVGRKSFILISYDYNGGGLDLGKYLTTIY